VGNFPIKGNGPAGVYVGDSIVAAADPCVEAMEACAATLQRERNNRFCNRENARRGLRVTTPEKDSQLAAGDEKTA
jgi:hypothetical protein